MAPIGHREVFEAVQVYPDGMQGDGAMEGSEPAGIVGVELAERQDLDLRTDGPKPQSPGQDLDDLTNSKRPSSVHFSTLLDPASPHNNGHGAGSDHLNGSAHQQPYGSENSKRPSARQPGLLDLNTDLDYYPSGLSPSEADTPAQNGQSTGTGPIRPPSPQNSFKHVRPKPVLKRSGTGDTTGAKLTHFSGSSIGLEDVDLDAPTPSTPSGPGAKLNRRGTGELQSHTGSEPREPHPFQQALQQSKSRLGSGGSNMHSDSSDYNDESEAPGTESDFDVYEYNQPEYEVTLVEEHGPLGVRVIAFRSHMLMVAEIYSDGAIPRWNRQHPECRVQVGDAILEISGSSPRERIGRASVRALEKYFTINAPEDGEHFTAWMKLRHDAFELYLGDVLGSKLPLGITLEAIDNGRFLKVVDVEEEGLVQEWNVEAIAWHLSLVQGDVIIEVNGEQGSAKAMLTAIKKAAKSYQYHLKVVHVNKAGQRILTRVESGKSSASLAD